MIEYAAFIISQFVFCLIFFWVIQKPLFIIYNRKSAKNGVRLGDIRNIYRHGAATDCISAAYLTALPLLSVWLYAHLPYYPLAVWLTVVNVVSALVVSLITVADTALYKFWQSKIDSSVFAYLRSLKGAFASVSAAYIAVALTAVAAVAALFFAGSETITLVYASRAYAADGWLGHIGAAAIALVAVGLLFLCIRGTGIRPNTPSIAFFSNIPFFNHSAVNPMYNLIYSLSVKDDYKGRFRFFDESECSRLFAPLFPTEGRTTTEILRTNRPNILIIVWESLCARYIESLGGMHGVTPNVTVMHEGVSFTQCASGSFRTDRALPCILSGLPGQPTASVIRHTRKLPHLPALPRVLKAQGYTTTALHGGDLSIMHKSDYYLAAGHDRLVGRSELPPSAPESKWGVNDGYTFEWLYNDIIDKTKRSEQWYTTFQTLNSHEPFDVPYDRIKGDAAANSYAYVDDCFGRFVEKLKQTPAWDNLLIVCTGDHGSNYDQSLSHSQYPHIPLFMIGGAVNGPMTIDFPVSQTDIPAILLGQLGLPHGQFMFSRDVLADTYVSPFSFHTYCNGFVLRDQRGVTDYDNDAARAVEGSDPKREAEGKAILQTLYEYLARI